MKLKGISLSNTVGSHYKVISHHDGDRYVIPSTVAKSVSEQCVLYVFYLREEEVKTN